MTNKQLANRLIDRGFDNTVVRSGSVRLACSQCDALAINGTATHETGCPNAVHECNGCNDLVPQNHRYCASCA